MKTRWESFVFILLMLLPAICLLNTALRPQAPVSGNTAFSQPCSSGTSWQTAPSGSEHDNASMRRNSVNSAGISSNSSNQSMTGKISK